MKQTQIVFIHVERHDQGTIEGKPDLAAVRMAGQQQVKLAVAQALGPGGIVDEQNVLCLRQGRWQRLALEQTIGADEIDFAARHFPLLIHQPVAAGRQETFPDSLKRDAAANIVVARHAVQRDFEAG